MSGGFVPSMDDNWVRWGSGLRGCRSPCHRFMFYDCGAWAADDVTFTIIRRTSFALLTYLRPSRSFRVSGKPTRADLTTLIDEIPGGLFVRRGFIYSNCESSRTKAPPRPFAG